MSDIDNTLGGDRPTEHHHEDMVPVSPKPDTPPTSPVLGADEPLPGDDLDEAFPEQVDAPEPAEPVDETEDDDVDPDFSPEELGVFYEKNIGLDKPVFKNAADKANWFQAMTLMRTTLDDWEARGGAGDLNDLTDEDQLEWWLAMAQSMDLIFPGAGLMKAVTRDGAEWLQKIPTLRDKGVEMRPREVRFDGKKQLGDSRVVRGHKAVEAFVSNTGIGRTVQIPLWRTGIWVTMRASTLSYLAEIDRALAFARPQLGMDTAGMLNSNEALIFEEVLVDAALRLVTNSTYPFAQSPLELRDVISSHDRDQLIWGMALAAWPDGTDVAIPCTDMECSNVDRVTANLLRMCFVDRASLTLDQLRLMDRATSVKVTDEELDKYQSTFLERERKFYEYNRRKLNFHIPSLSQYFANGRQWINSINIAITEAMGEAVNDDNKRAALIDSMVSSEQLCRYGHYIHSISIPTTRSDDDEDEDSSLLVESPDDIRNILKMISAEPEAVNGLLLAIDDYIQSSTISVIGYPNVPCSKCGKLHLTRGEARVIIPFPAATGFFILAQHKMRLSSITVMTDLSTLGIRNFVRQVSANAQMISSAQPQS